MIQTQCIGHIHAWRKWGFDEQDPRLGRLAHIERKVPSFLISDEGAAERSWLVRSMGEERLGRIASRILRPKDPSSTLRFIEASKEKISLFVQQMSQSAFRDLPEEVQDLFDWAVWVHQGALSENKKKLNGQVSLLCEIESPLLYLKGKTLCEQMLHLYEMRHLLEKQRNTVQILQEISDKIHLPYANVNELLRKLPTSLKWKLHEDVYTFSSHRIPEHKWGKREILQNPKSLVQLRNSHGKNLLEHHLQEQKERLQALEQVREVEEFDRLTLLYRMLSGAQWQAVLDKAPPKVRESIAPFETTAHKKKKIDSDTRHLYQWRGAHPKIDQTHFQVFAPHARQVNLILTAFGNEEHSIPMERKDFGVFETRTDHASVGRTYRYQIEDCHGHWNYRTDPFSFSVKETGSALESVVTDSEVFPWNDDHWMKERLCDPSFKKPLSIYELHVDSWKKQEGRPLSFHELASSIVQYRQKVPFTHVQLYGLLDNKNDYSWGYQTDHFFAPNRRVGFADDFKFFVDLCHQHGIGVIIDWAPGHYKHEHSGDRSQSIHDYDGTSLFGAESSAWGTMFFDFNKEETKRFLLASALYWFEKNHVDGLRVDAVSPMVRRYGEDQSAAIDFLKELNTIVHEQYRGLMIAEETDWFPGVTRPVSEGGLGFDAKVAVHMQNRIRNYFRTPHDQRDWGEHHFGKLLSNLNEIFEGNEEWLIAHSHDDAAAGSLNRHSTIYGSIPSTDTWTKFADMRLFHAWNLLSPGFGHGIHMGDEIGQRWPWNERLQVDEGAVEWHLLDNHAESSFHRGLQECVGDLNRFYLSRQPFWKEGRRGYRLISHHPQNKVIGLRCSNISLFFNFSPQGYSEYDFPLSELCPIKGAKEVFNTDGIQYGGSGQFRNTSAFIVTDGKGNATHFRFTFPPLSLVAFEEF
ncbi:MAG: alpha amylase C-terminal domain-containing protein [Rhabdochlamydiaceae bacterium]